MSVRIIYVFPDQGFVNKLEDFILHRTWSSGEYLLAWVNEFKENGAEYQQVVDIVNALGGDEVPVVDENENYGGEDDNDDKSAEVDVVSPDLDGPEPAAVEEPVVDEPEPEPAVAEKKLRAVKPV